MKKRLLSVLIALTLVVATISSTTAFAAETGSNGSTYYPENGDYVANKLTHTQNGTQSADGIVDYAGNATVTDEITGVGDRAQSYSWSALGYGDYVYIGTCPNAMTSTLSLMKSVLGDNYDEEQMQLTFNTMFNGTFFYGEEDGGDPKGILVKLNTKTGEVKLLMSKATTNTNILFRNAVEYNGMLYFCGSVNGLPCIYQINPENDQTTCVYQSISAADYYKAFQLGISVGIRGICVYEGKLIVSLVGLDGAYICSTDNPSDPDSFEVIADMNDLFNYPAYHYSDSIYGGSVWDMVEYNNSLYVVLCTGTPDNKPDSNTMQSFALVRGDIDESGKWAWTAVAGDQENDNARYTFGIDPERTRSGAANLCVYNDYLYIGEYNDEEIAIEDIMFSKNCNFVNANLEQSVNLYRMDADENMELVVGDADEMFPDGSLTNYGSGFGRNENQYIWRMQVYNNKLYLGTFDTSSLLEPIGQFTNGNIINMTPEQWGSQLDYLTQLLQLIFSKKNTTNEKITLADVSTSLSKKQRTQIVETVNDIDTDEIYNNNIKTALDLSSKLEELKQMLNDNVSEEFLEKYSEVYEIFSNLSSKLPNSIVESFKNLITEETLDNIKSFIVCAAYLRTADRGFDLYVIDDEDMSVETVTTNGFGDPYNHGCRVFAINNSGLIIGTANPFYGTQVWRLGSLYDVNLDGYVDIEDVTYLQKIISEVIETPESFSEYGDVNDDGIVDISDVTHIQKYLAGIL
jgi:hypothetical protein